VVRPDGRAGGRTRATPAARRGVGGRGRLEGSLQAERLPLLLLLLCAPSLLIDGACARPPPALRCPGSRKPALDPGTRRRAGCLVLLLLVLLAWARAARRLLGLFAGPPVCPRCSPLDLDDACRLAVRRRLRRRPQGCCTDAGAAAAACFARPATARAGAAPVPGGARSGGGGTGTRKNAACSLAGRLTPARARVQRPRLASPRWPLFRG
jgi:hypothetical protein